MKVPKKDYERLKSMRKLDRSFTYFLMTEVGLKYDSSALKDVRIVFVDGAHALELHRGTDYLVISSSSTTIHLDTWNDFYEPGTTIDGPWNKPVSNSGIHDATERKCWW